MPKKTAKKKKADKPVVQEGDYSKFSDGQDGNRVFIAIGKTINVGNYESVRIEVGQGKVVPGGDFEGAKQACIQEVLSTMRELVEMVDSGGIE